ncbi:MAG: TIGR03086 family metal-binding protein, partial [Gordonia sp. (in: high G+C Gram-positive bacteria)]|uniref:TIGR03086 family metal-binding protein n=1 Tax=Gordonia sp. (in: high G+C Gram-positive bacteria) TaxID=84139 RepID=UPI003BB5EA80
GQWWAQRAAEARAAADTVDDLDRVVDSPMGPRTVREGLSFPAVDLFIHGWDLAAAIGNSVEIPPAAITFIEAMFGHIPDEASRQPGVFGPKRDAARDATPTAALIAFTGRDPGF